MVPGMPKPMQGGDNGNSSTIRTTTVPPFEPIFILTVPRLDATQPFIEGLDHAEVVRFLDAVPYESFQSSIVVWTSAMTRETMTVSTGQKKANEIRACVVILPVDLTTHASICIWLEIESLCLCVLPGMQGFARPLVKHPMKKLRNS